MCEIKCGSLDCKYNGEEYNCLAKDISLSESYVNTTYQGYAHFWVCDKYEMDERSKEVEVAFKKLFCK